MCVLAASKGFWFTPLGTIIALIGLVVFLYLSIKWTNRKHKHKPKE